MDKRIVICIVVILSLAFLALLANQFFEIYPAKRRILPSYEVTSNNFYAVEQWLSETGHPVRIENDYSPEQIAEAHEKAALVFNFIYDWAGMKEHLIPWVEKGNSLVIFINSYYVESAEVFVEFFFNDFGIEAERTDQIQYVDNFADNIQNFDISIRFLADDSPDKLIIKDDQGFIRLVQVYLGEGKLIVTGHPYFMYNYYLDKEINAALAWELTGAQTTEQNPGVLFIRRQNYRNTPNSMFGKIMERGNLIPVIISAVLLIVIGFWSVIPVFGVVLHEKQKKSRPIRERFSAEIKFLKKYKALNYYLETYSREIQSDNKPEKDYNYRELINKIRSVCNGTDKFKR